MNFFKSTFVKIILLALFCNVLIDIPQALYDIRDSNDKILSSFESAAEGLTLQFYENVAESLTHGADFNEVGLENFEHIIDFLHSPAIPEDVRNIDIIASSGKTLLPDQNTEYSTTEISQTENQIKRVEDLYHVFIPVIFEKAFQGWFVVSFDSQPIQTEIYANITKTSTSTLLALFLYTISFALGLTIVFRRPIRIITEFIDEVSTTGKFSSKIRELSEGEFGVIARFLDKIVRGVETLRDSFNQTLDTIETQSTSISTALEKTQIEQAKAIAAFQPNNQLVPRITDLVVYGNVPNPIENSLIRSTNSILNLDRGNQTILNNLESLKGDLNGINHDLSAIAEETYQLHSTFFPEVPGTEPSHSNNLPLSTLFAKDCAHSISLNSSMLNRHSQFFREQLLLLDKLQKAPLEVSNTALKAPKQRQFVEALKTVQRPFPNSNDIKILIFDDHDSCQSTWLSGILSKSDMNFSVEKTFHCVDEILSTCKSLRPNIVLIDLQNRKGKNTDLKYGLEAIQTVATHFPETLIIAVSQHWMPVIIESAENCGASAYLSKFDFQSPQKSKEEYERHALNLVSFFELALSGNFMVSSSVSPGYQTWNRLKRGLGDPAKVDVFRKLLWGYSTKEIAEARNCTTAAVRENYRKGFEALGIDTSAGNQENALKAIFEKICSEAIQSESFMIKTK